MTSTIEFVTGAGGLLALIIPAPLSGPRWRVVQLIMGDLLKLDVALSKRWQVWGVFHVADWVSPPDRPRVTLKLQFLE